MIHWIAYRSTKLRKVCFNKWRKVGADALKHVRLRLFARRPWQDAAIYGEGCGTWEDVGANP